MGPTGCSETPVRNYHSTLRKIAKERISHSHRGRSLKSRKNTFDGDREFLLSVMICTVRNIILSVGASMVTARSYCWGRKITIFFHPDFL
jgi:hypothetical protein